MIWVFITSVLVTSFIGAAIVFNYLIDEKKEVKRRFGIKNYYLFQIGLVFIMVLCVVSLFALMGMGVSSMEESSL